MAKAEDLRSGDGLKFAELFTPTELPWFYIFMLACFASTVTIGDRILFDMQFSGLGWLGPLTGSLLVLAARKEKSTFKLLPWMPWIFLVCVYAAFSTAENAWHRSLIMLTPLAVLKAAATYRLSRSQLMGLVRAFAIIVVLMAIAVVAKSTDLLSAQKDEYAFPAESISAVFLFSVFAALVLRGIRALIPFALIAAAVPVISVNRAAIVSLLYVVILGFLPIRLRLRVLLGFVGLILAAAAFQLESVQNKMFFSGEGTLADLTTDNPNLRTSGRQVIWTYLMGRVEEDPMLGHGANASESVVYALTEGITHPHNDWLRILFDYGALGILLFVIGYGSLLLDSLRGLKRVVGLDKSLFAACATALVAFGLLMVTDNILLYTAYFGSPLMLMLGSLFARRDTGLASRPGSS